jgi:hypothetical protein
MNAVPARLKPHLVNAALVIVSVLATYVLLEYAMFRLLLPAMPLQIRPHLPDIADVLAQNSKAHYLPQDYVALLGDSYAEGLGDWLLQTGGNQAKPFHSANVIHELTGRDVVSFGKGGAGSAEAAVLRPSRVFPTSGCSVFPTIEPPRQMFVYFYEGNDLEDNLHFLDKVRGRYGSADAPMIDRYLAEQYAIARPWHCHLQLLDMGIRMAQFLHSYYAGEADITSCGMGQPNANRLLVGGRIVEAPALHGPAAGVTDDNVPVAMRVLARSLAWLRHRFPGVPITVVYVPAALSVYRPAGEEVFHCSNAGTGWAPAAQVAQRSDRMCDFVRRIALDLDLRFMDARPALRAAATQPVHGPRDWDHLNEAGYRALGALVAEGVDASSALGSGKSGGPASTCGPPSRSSLPTKSLLATSRTA